MSPYYYRGTIFYIDHQDFNMALKDYLKYLDLIAKYTCQFYSFHSTNAEFSGKQLQKDSKEEGEEEPSVLAYLLSSMSIVYHLSSIVIIYHLSSVVVYFYCLSSIVIAYRLSYIVCCLSYINHISKCYLVICCLCRMEKSIQYLQEWHQ